MGVRELCFSAIALCPGLSPTVAVLPRARQESSGRCCSPRIRSVTQHPHRPAGVTELRPKDLDGSTGSVHHPPSPPPLPPPTTTSVLPASQSDFTPLQGLIGAHQAPARRRRASQVQRPRSPDIHFARRRRQKCERRV